LSSKLDTKKEKAHMMHVWIHFWPKVILKA